MKRGDTDRAALRRHILSLLDVPGATQRGVASDLGISLGMLHRVAFPERSRSYWLKAGRTKSSSRERKWAPDPIFSDEDNPLDGERGFWRAHERTHSDLIRQQAARYMRWREGRRA